MLLLLDLPCNGGEDGVLNENLQTAGLTNWFGGLLGLALTLEDGDQPLGHLEADLPALIAHGHLTLGRDGGVERRPVAPEL